MRFSTLLALAASLAAVSATPSPAPGSALVARSGDGFTEIAKRSGCGSSGPLGTGHFVWFIDVSCTPGAQKSCQATDSTGCLPGNPDKIGSMEVDDPNDTFQIAKKSDTNTVTFICPSGGQVRCQANFNDSDDGPGYSLRGTCLFRFPSPLTSHLHYLWQSSKRGHLGAGDRIWGHIHSTP
ncbi:hypothetical protein C8Q78DRAFT_373138 [Trametes maxima]|nr:hypothetical protein C8Q78DRAFT_373138 [Trametes maxima]